MPFPAFDAAGRRHHCRQYHDIRHYSSDDSSSIFHERDYAIIAGGMRRGDVVASRRHEGSARRYKMNRIFLLILMALPLRLPPAATLRLHHLSTPPFT